MFNLSGKIKDVYHGSYGYPHKTYAVGVIHIDESTQEKPTALTKQHKRLHCMVQRLGDASVLGRC